MSVSQILKIKPRTKETVWMFLKTYFYIHTYKYTVQYLNYSVSIHSN